MYLTQDVLSRLERRGGVPLSAPEYAEGTGARRSRIGMAVESMRRHMTDEGWQLFTGLKEGGYSLCGKDILTPFGLCGIPHMTDTKEMLRLLEPSVVVLQDKREWEGLTADRSCDPMMRFTNVGALRTRPDVFKMTVLKDAQNNPTYHQTSAEEIGCHAWIVYYTPAVISRLAPFVRQQHVVRTWHTVDRELVPPYTPEGRSGCLLSGAMNRNVYPLRQRIHDSRDGIHGLTVLGHPGYHRKGCNTPEFLRTLSRFKVAICTASIYGYALRKIVEATACGCAVITDLPADEIMLGGIDGNLHRVHPDSTVLEISNLVDRLCADYDLVSQERYAALAKDWYDWRAMGRRLADDIETLRRNYA